VAVRRVPALVERLREQATLDALTGAANRWEFERRLFEELHRVDRTGGNCALVVFDIDHFKRVNDSFGRTSPPGSAARSSR
jgi:diguanylate cyclase (GGDEF)-like protein